MLYYKNGKYYLSKLKVHYIDEHEGDIVKYIGSEGKNWWINFAKKWKDTFKLIDIFEVDNYTREQYQRLDKVNKLNLPEDISYIEKYVLEGSFEDIERNHPLYILKLEEENEKIKSEMMIANMELYQTLSVMDNNYKLESAKNMMDILKLVSTIEGGGE